LFKMKKTRAASPRISSRNSRSVSEIGGSADARKIAASAWGRNPRAASVLWR
jgi:hypothetical protein